MVNVALAKKGVEDVLDEGLASLRQAMVDAYVTDKPFLINLGLLGPDFNSVYRHDKVWPSETIFDWAALQNTPGLLPREKERQFLRDVAMSAAETAVSDAASAADVSMTNSPKR